MKKETKKVVISTRVVYHKYAEITIEVPSNIKDEDIDEWIVDNDDFSEELDQKLSDAKFEFGFGLGNGMDDKSEESETRFDVYDLNGKITYGGHC
jgi:hypothetical protein